MHFIDLQAQYARISERVDSRILSAVRSGRYILGPEVQELEAALARFCGASHALGCANGTDALALALMAWGVRPGDAVFCPSFTFTATAEVVPWLGASPVFVDIDPYTYNMDAEHLAASIEMVKASGKLHPKVVIAVDLFGQPANYPAISEVARNHDLKLIADSAQGFGCTLYGQHPSSWSDITTTSFFPAKPLGCYGDGGAIFTNDASLAELMESLAVHGKAMPRDIAGRNFDHDPKYWNVRIGMNSRLDTIQAAILLEKLAIFPDEIAARNRIAARYSEHLTNVAVSVPEVISGGVSTWAQYTIEHTRRDALAAHLKARGIPTAVYYPIPIHQQEPYAHFPSGPGGLPVTEEKAGRVISLPMHPYLEEGAQDLIIRAIRDF